MNDFFKRLLFVAVFFCATSTLFVKGASAGEDDGPYYASVAIAQLDGLDQDFEVAGPLSREGSAGVDASTGFEVIIGRDLMDRLSVELGVQWHKSDLGDVSYSKFGHFPLDLVNQTAALDGDAEITVMTLGVVYDFENDTAWTPYIGGAIGKIDLTLDSKLSALGQSRSFSDSGSSLAKVIKAGVRRDGLGKNKDISVDFGYRNLSSNSLDLSDNGEDISFGSGLDGLNIFQIGIRKQL